MFTRIILFFSLVIVTVNLSAQSQDLNPGKNQIRLGYGVLTAPEMANSLMSVWPAIGMTIWKDTITDYVCSFYGVASLEYLRHLKPWVAVGISLSVNPISTLITTKHGKELTWNYYLLNVMPRVDFYYLNKGIFSMYSGVQAGATVIFWQDRLGSANMTDSGVTFAYHVNAFGIRIGKEFGAYMEWGFGFRGVVNAGISAKF